MTGPFDSAWYKWARAVTHAHALDKDILDFIQNTDLKSFTLRVGEYNGKRHGFPVEVATAAALPKPWGLLLGDVVSNYRSALEHVAWAVVARGKQARLTKKQAKSVAFPIASTRDDFNSGIPWMLPGATRADVARIRKYQPYKAGVRLIASHCLTVLKILSDHDKHRTIQPVALLPTTVMHKVSKTHDCVPLLVSPKLREPRILNVGTEIGFLRVRKTGPNPEIEMHETEFKGAIGIHTRARLDRWFMATHEWIGQLLLEFAPQPEDIGDLDDARFYPA